MSPRNPSIKASPSRGAFVAALISVRSGPSGSFARICFDQSERLLDLLDANPDAGIDIAFRAGRDFEGEFRIRRIGSCAARVEAASGCPADEAAAAILACEIGGENARPDGAILQRCGQIIDFDKMREVLADLAQQRLDHRQTLRGQIMRHAAGHDSVHHQPMAEAKIGSA